MTTVRPPIFPPPQPAAEARPDPARLAAQRAFFEAALAAATGPASTPPAADRTTEPVREAPPRIARPGSLLDIRV